MTIAAAILAAGRGTRFGADKVRVLLKGKPLWRYSFETFLDHPEIDEVGVVCVSEALDELRSLAPEASFVVSGGATRQESAKAALQAAGGCHILLVHDAARPFVKAETITEVIRGIHECGAAAPAIPVSDTIRDRSAGQAKLLDRATLAAMQTPQGARVDLLKVAFAKADKEFTDEIAVLDNAGITSQLVKGDPGNFKITSAEDIARALAVLGPPETRTGIGYDVHAFSRDPARKLYLGGVLFEGSPGLDGHSDADALAHAVVDALLGAAGAGDIGQHFPNTVERWRGQSSIYFLEQTKDILQALNWRILNIDATLIAEHPKVMQKAEAIREAISTALAIAPSRVSIKATTNERLGAIGRGEGIAAFAVATLAERA